MTLEAIGNEPQTLEEQIEFVRNRMNRFWKAARKHAIIADKIMSDAEEAFRTEHGYKHPGASRRQQDDAWISRQYIIMTTGTHYKNAVDAQQMYDRWTMREAAMLQALTNYQQYSDRNEEKRHDRVVKSSFIPSPRRG